MSGTVSWMLVLLGPFALVLVPQWLGRKALAKKGLPESLDVARTTLLGFLMESRITVSHRVDGERQIPLQHMVGDSIPETTRDQNRQKLQAYQRYLDGKLMLPVVYRMEPGIILGFIYAIVNIIAGPGSGHGIGETQVQYAHTTGLVLTTAVCASVCTAVALAYLRILDVLARVGR